MITKSTLIAWFNLYNEKYYNNAIKSIPIIVSTRKTKGRCGTFSHRWSITLFLNNPLMQHENDVRGTLIHEMMHAYLFQRFGWRLCGHTPTFKVKLTSIFRQEFPNARLTNVTHHQNLGTAPTKEIPVETFMPLLQMIRTQEPVAPVAVMTNRYKVVSTGKIGTFVRESMVYGRKHISLQIEGMLFPFTTAMNNVIPA